MGTSHPCAVVIGASMSGLLAARALSGHFERVLVVERDVLTEHDGEARKGVPQSAHAHGLLASGYRILDTYFRGMMDELEARGAPRGDVVGDFLWFQYGRWKSGSPDASCDGEIPIPRRRSTRTWSSTPLAEGPRQRSGWSNPASVVLTKSR